MIIREILHEPNRLLHNPDCAPFTTIHLPAPTSRKKLSKLGRKRLKEAEENLQKTETQMEAVSSDALLYHSSLPSRERAARGFVSTHRTPSTRPTTTGCRHQRAGPPSRLASAPRLQNYHNQLLSFQDIL